MEINPIKTRGDGCVFTLNHNQQQKQRKKKWYQVNINLEKSNQHNIKDDTENRQEKQSVKISHF